MANDPIDVSRREFLKGGVALAALPHNNLLLGSTLHMTSGPGWVALHHEDRVIYRLRADSFAGRSSLWSEHDTRRIAFGIEDARHPGLDLGADAIIELWQGQLGVQVTIDHLGLGVLFRGDAADWLAGPGLQTYVRSSCTLLDASGAVIRVAPGPVTLRGDGTLHFGEASVTLHKAGLCLSAVATKLQPVSDENEQNESTRYTSLVFERGSNIWDIPVPRGRWTYDDPQDLFHSLSIYARETDEEERSHEATFMRSPRRPAFHITLDEPLYDSNKSPLDFQFRDAEYRIDLATGDNRLEAKLAMPQSLTLGPLRLTLSQPSALPAMQAGTGAGAIVTSGALSGEIDTALLIENDHEEWQINITPEENQAAADFQSTTLSMCGDTPQLDGALQFRILRPQDALDLNVRLTNVSLVPSTIDPRIVPATLNIKSLDPDYSLLILDFPPQAMVTPTILSSKPQASDDCSQDLAAAKAQYPNGVHSRISARSRISVQLFDRDDIPPLQLTLGNLLRVANYPLNIDSRAVCKNPEKPSGADAAEWATQFVGPAGLTLSPDETHAVFASEVVREDEDITQVWTARLSKRLDSDPVTEGSNSLFPVTENRRPELRVLHSRQLVGQGYLFSQADLDVIANELRSKVAQARRFVLSTSHGGWIDVGAAWMPTEANGDRSSFQETIAGSWEQKGSMTYEAFLAPTGHRVTVVKQANLQWCRDGVNTLVARLIERFKIVYVDTTISYADLRKSAPQWTATTLPLPFDSITLIGKETPFLDAPAADTFTQGLSGNPTNYWAWIDPSTTLRIPYAFPVQLVDRAGKKHRTTMQMLIAGYAQAYDKAKNPALVQAYNVPPPCPAGADPATCVNTSVNLHGERVAYATETKTGNTSYSTGIMSMQVAPVGDLAAAQANKSIPWYPVMADTQLQLEQVQAFSNPGENFGRSFVFSSVYLKNPFDISPHSDNASEILLKLKPAPQPPGAPAGTPDKTTSVGMNFNGELGGGLVKPSTNVVALARKAGTVFHAVQGDINDLESYLTDVGKSGMRIANIFHEVADDVNLLGAVSLGDVLDEVSDGITQAARLPLLAAQEIQDLEAETLGKIKSTVQPILDARNTAIAYRDQYLQAIESARDDLRQSVKVATALARVLAQEQRPDDLNFLASQTIDPQLSNLTKNLQSLMDESTKQTPLQRILAATTFPTDANPPYLPTLLRIRDFALNSVIASTDATIQKDTQALSQKLDDELQNELDTFNQTLDDLTTQAGQSIGDLTNSLIFQFAAAADNLNTAINSVDVEAALEAIEDVSEVIASVQSIAESYQSLRADITKELDSFKQLSSAQSPGAARKTMPVLEQRTKALSSDISTLGSFLPAGVRQQINDGLDDAKGVVFDHCQAVLNAVQEKIDAANALIQNVLNTTAAAYVQLQNSQTVQQIEEAIGIVRDLLNVPRKVAVSYTYNTTLHNAGPFLADLHGNKSTLSVQSNVTIDLQQPKPQFDISVEVDNFRLLLLPSFSFVIIGFTKARFESINGNAPVIHCPFNAGDIQFVGPLDFVADLAKSLGLPPYMNVQLNGLTAIIGLNVLIPPIACGAFNIVGLSVYTAVHVDFTGKPMQLIFGFANPNQHFTMTYLFLGGGGFINLEFAPLTSGTGLAVTAALEGGAMAALDFGVAQGEVHIFAGFYLSMRPADLLLSGYFRAGGEFDVLGLISASIEFIMSLSYEDRGGHAILSGDCEVDIDVHVLFFSASVSLHMHHEFAGTGGS